MDKQKPQPRQIDRESEPTTFYTLGGFGYRRTEARSFALRVGKHAQYPAALIVTSIEKGKRKAQSFADSDLPSLIVLAGHGHPAPRNAMSETRTTETGTPGVRMQTSMTRWSCYAPEWAQDFYQVIDPYLEAHPEALIADYRGFDTSGGERLAELRAGAMLTAGDRVVTPEGPGLVMYRRMEPPEFSRPACFSVKLDGHNHAGAIFPAAVVRWEGAAP